MRSSVRAIGAASAVTVLVVTAGAWFGYQQLAGPACSGEVRLAVAATPEIAPAIEAAANQWTADGAAVGGTCIRVDVSASEPVDVAAAVAGKHGATVAGVGQASGTAVTPDVWVPDSSTWLVRLKTDGATAFAPSNGASIARSPVVVAVPEPVASSRFKWPEQKATWKDLLDQVRSDKPLRAGIVEPTRDAAGLSGLLSLTTAAAAAGPAAEAQKATTGALRALATGSSALRQELLSRFPRANDPTTIASGLGAAALSEEDVIAYNETKPPIPLAALYLDPPPTPLDYPYAVLPGIEPAKAAAANVLFELLTTPGFRNRLAAQALRSPDGNWGEGFKAPQGAPSPAGGQASAAPAGVGAAGGMDPVAIKRAVSGWSIATMTGRMLAIVDVSGSMKQPVPSARNLPRQTVTVEAARRGLGLFDDSWSIGLWVFSTKLNGSKPWKQVVPIQPLSSNRSRLEQGLAGIRSTSGDTGLYDTVLDGYKAVQENWEPGRVNSIVLFTDGQNDNASGITQAKLLSDLERLKDPERPIQVIIIGIGDKVSQAELKAITDKTGGAQFVAKDPSKIGDVFLSALSLRPRTR